MGLRSAWGALHAPCNARWPIVCRQVERLPVPHPFQWVDVFQFHFARFFFKVRGMGGVDVWRPLATTRGLHEGSSPVGSAGMSSLPERSLLALTASAV